MWHHLCEEWVSAVMTTYFNNETSCRHSCTSGREHVGSVCFVDGWLCNVLNVFGNDSDKPLINSCYLVLCWFLVLYYNVFYNSLVLCIEWSGPAEALQLGTLLVAAATSLQMATSGSAFKIKVTNNWVAKHNINSSFNLPKGSSCHEKWMCCFFKVK